MTNYEKNIYSINGVLNISMQMILIEKQPHFASHTGALNFL
jgi:hypothetical protein